MILLIRSPAVPDRVSDDFVNLFVFALGSGAHGREMHFRIVCFANVSVLRDAFQDWTGPQAASDYFVNSSAGSTGQGSDDFVNLCVFALGSGEMLFVTFRVRKGM